MSVTKFLEIKKRTITFVKNETNDFWVTYNEDALLVTENSHFQHFMSGDNQLPAFGFPAHSTGMYSQQLLDCGLIPQFNR